MQVTLNGEPRTLSSQCKLLDALTEWGYKIDMPMAVAIDNKVIHKQYFSATDIHPDSVIEILMPMQGG